MNESAILNLEWVSISRIESGQKNVSFQPTLIAVFNEERREELIVRSGLSGGRVALVNGPLPAVALAPLFERDARRRVARDAVEESGQQLRAVQSRALVRLRTII